MRSKIIAMTALAVALSVAPAAFAMGTPPSGGGGGTGTPGEGGGPGGGPVVSAVEPSALLAVGLGLAAVARLRRRR